MTRPTLLLISFSNISRDARVLKQVAAFAEQYELITCGHGPKPGGVVDHLEIPGDAQAWQYRRLPVILRRYRAAYWSNPAVTAAAALVRGRAFDVVFANDIDSVGLALSLTTRGGVHVDLHEYAPRQRLHLLRWRLFVAPFVRWMCRAFVTRAQSVTTVSSGLAKEYRREFGIEAAVVTNATPFQLLPVNPVGDPIRLVHSGACLRSRHLDIMIDAVAKSTRAVTLDLFLTVNDPRFHAELVQQAASVAGVTVRDAVPYDDLVATLNGYDVGVFVLPPVNFNYRWALPNKLFDFVQARLGVIIGPSPEMAEVVADAGTGRILADFSPDALAAAIDDLTPREVLGWKVAADDAAERLSSDAQVRVWKNAVDALVDRAAGV